MIWLSRWCAATSRQDHGHSWKIFPRNIRLNFLVYDRSVFIYFYWLVVVNWEMDVICSKQINSDKSKYNNATIINSTTKILNSIWTSIRSSAACTKWLLSNKQFDYINCVNHTQTIQLPAIPYNIFSFN